MARQNYTRLGRRPERVELLIPRVLRSERVSPTYQRVTLAGADLSRLDPLGLDQWVRLFIPAPGGADHLQRVPARLTPAAYVRFKAIPRTDRPLTRSYTIRTLRRDASGATEIDIDLVLHTGPDGDLAPAAAWAATCRPGDPVALLDAGTGFAPPPGVRHVRLVADETAVPAAAAILAGLDPDVTGSAVLEVPDEGDRLPLAGPAGMEVRYVLRGEHTLPGEAALVAATADPAPPSPAVYCWSAGEATLATGMRRHWAAHGVPKDRICFCGYWRASQHPAPGLL